MNNCAAHRCLRPGLLTSYNEVMTEWIRSGYRISTDREQLDVDMIWGFLRESYWAANIPRATVERAIDGSMAFGLYHGSRQIGFARVITDKATFAYLADVFVLDEFRGKGLGEWLIQVIIEHPDLAGLRRWSLATRDAHALYAKFGFTPLRDPARFMEIHRPDIYKEPVQR
jgi:GNAT superfamily N-acetyltransferase